MKFPTIVCLSLFLTLIQTSWSAIDKQRPNAAEPVKLTLNPIELTDDTGKIKIEIKNDGSLVYKGQNMGTIKITGAVLGKDGKALAKLNDNGEVLTQDGKSIGKIPDNGEIQLADKRTFSWNKNQLKLGPGGPRLTMKPFQPESRRLASLVLLLFFTN